MRIQLHAKHTRQVRCNYQVGSLERRDTLQARTQHDNALNDITALGVWNPSQQIE